MEFTNSIVSLTTFTARSLVTAHQAIKNTYESLGLSLARNSQSVSRIKNISYDYDFDSVIDYSYSYGYDEQGNRISKKYDFANDGVIDSTITLTYDLTGHIIKQDFDFGDAVTYPLYEFDDVGNLIKKTNFSSGVMRSFSQYTYDNMSRRISDNSYDANSELTLTVQTDFENPNNPLDKTITYTYHQLTDKDKVLQLKYDVQGNLISRHLDYVSDTRTDSKVIYSYNEAGKRSLEEVYFTGEEIPRSTFTYLYDEKGNIESFSKPNKLVDYENSYDDAENLSSVLVHYSGSKRYVDELGNSLESANGTIHKIIEWQDISVANLEQLNNSSNLLCKESFLERGLSSCTR